MHITIYVWTYKLHTNPFFRYQYLVLSHLLPFLSDNIQSNRKVSPILLGWFHPELIADYIVPWLLAAFVNVTDVSVDHHIFLEIYVPEFLLLHSS